MDDIIRTAQGLTRRGFLELLFDAEEPREMVRSISGQELVLVMEDLEGEDALMLLAYASPEQLTSIVDMTCWRGTSFDMVSFTDWFHRILQADREQLDSLVGQLDEELLVLIVQHLAHVVPFKEEVEIDTERFGILPSPDGVFQLVHPIDSPFVPLLKHLVDVMFARDVRWATSLLQACRWELPSGLEEQSLGFAQARLESQGISSWESAMTMYARSPLGPLVEELRHDEVDAPHAVVFQGHRITDVAVELAGGLPTLLGSVVAEHLDADARTAFVQEFTYLVNGALVARKRPLTSKGAMGESARHVAAMLNLGLERLAPGAPDRAARLVRHHHPRRLFALGFGLVSRLTERLGRVGRSFGAKRVESLFDPPDGPRLGPLSRRFPLYLPVGGGEPREITTLEELEELDALVSKVEAVSSFMEVMVGRVVAPSSLVDRDEQWRHATFSTILATLLARTVLDGAPSLEQLTRGELTTMVSLLFDDGAFRPEARETIGGALSWALEQLTDLDEEGRGHVEAFFGDTLERMEQVLGHIVPDGEPVDPRFLGNVVLVDEGRHVAKDA